MGQNQENFYLHFTQELVASELVIKGGRRDPLDGMVTDRIASVDQYGDVMLGEEIPVYPLFDFRVHGVHEEIVRKTSPGKKDKIYSICVLPKRLRVLIEALCDFMCMCVH